MPEELETAQELHPWTLWEWLIEGMLALILIGIALTPLIF